ncbi:MAG TPA: ATP-binding protein [Burkholderiaceae bacterium]|jgi:signal transduction histidine kinase/ActR/RegA family two-component response regulator
MKLPATKLVSLQTYLCAVMLVATVPLALLLAYQVFSSLQTQHQRMRDELQRTALLVTSSVEHDLEARAPGTRSVARSDTAHWQRLLDSSAPPGGFIQLSDSSGRPISASEGVSLLASSDSALYSVTQTVPGTDWRIDVSVPAAVLDDAERRMLLAAMATIAAGLLLGLGLATLAARRISDPLRELATGGPGPARRTRVQEVAWLREALTESQTQQAQAQASLQRKATEFETLFASTPIGLAVLREGVAEDMRNAAMSLLFAHGRTLYLDGQPLARDQQPLQRAAATGQPVGPLELELRERGDLGDGKAPRHVLMQAVPLLDANGQVQGALESAVDITARKTAEQRVLQADRQLQESQRLIDLAQEAGEVGFFSIDAGATTWTPGQARLFGFDGLAGSPGSAGSPGTLGDLLERIHEEDRSAVEDGLRAMVEHRRDRSTLEFRVNLPDGGTNWLSSRVLMNFDGEGRPQQLVGATLNVNEQKSLELERQTLASLEQRARIEAEAANRAKDEFIAMLGHELRNPLGAIGSAAEVLNQLSSGANVVNERVDIDLGVSARAIIARQTNHLARLVDDLLDVGRVISGKVILHRQPFDLAALMERAVENFRVTGALEHHDVRVHSAEVWVEADSTRIEQVINNLLGNALKYTPAGRRIELTLQSHNGHAFIEVRDEGDGISPVLLPHVFDLFVQGERSLDRGAGGLGIGLTLVRRLVEMHGGTVTVESSPAGSTFTVQLAELPANVVSSFVPAACEPEAHCRLCRVLVIEDNEDARDTLRTLLELDGHSVATAETGPQGLDLLLGERPDVAIVDIGLPGLSGFELAKLCRRAGYAGQLLALSGYSSDADVAQALRNGFDAHLAKPVDSQRLRRLMADAPNVAAAHANAHGG